MLSKASKDQLNISFRRERQSLELYPVNTSDRGMALLLEDKLSGACIMKSSEGEDFASRLKPSDIINITFEHTIQVCVHGKQENSK